MSKIGNIHFKMYEKMKKNIDLSKYQYIVIDQQKHSLLYLNYTFVFHHWIEHTYNEQNRRILVFAVGLHIEFFCLGHDIHLFTRFCVQWQHIHKCASLLTYFPQKKKQKKKKLSTFFDTQTCWAVFLFSKS